MQDKEPVLWHESISTRRQGLRYPAILYKYTDPDRYGGVTKEEAISDAFIITTELLFGQEKAEKVYELMRSDGLREEKIEGKRILKRSTLEESLLPFPKQVVLLEPSTQQYIRNDREQQFVRAVLYLELFIRARVPEDIARCSAMICWAFVFYTQNQFLDIKDPKVLQQLAIYTHIVNGLHNLTEVIRR